MNNPQLHVKPAYNQTFTQRDYWTNVCPSLADTRNPDWAFDFIGLHPDRFTGQWSLTSPSCLWEGKESEGQTKPAWQKLSWNRKEYALSFAQSLARQHNVFVIDCSVTLGMD